MNLAKVILERHQLIGRTLTTRSTHKEFKITGISERGLMVLPVASKSAKDRVIRALEVELMGKHWQDYKGGLITRSELANGKPQIFNTSYLESIFYDIEAREQSQLQTALLSEMAPA